MKAIKRLVEANELKMEIIPNPKVISVPCNGRPLHAANLENNIGLHINP